MTGFKRAFSAIILISLVLVLQATNLLPVLAQTSNNQTSQNNGSGLQISPTRTDLAANPGETKTFKVSLKNVTQGTIIAKASLNDFVSDNETGQPRLLADSKQHTDYSLNKFISGLEDVTIEAGKTVEQTITVSLPGNAAPGGYYGAVRYSAIPASESSSSTAKRQISLTASVASLVLLEVSGNIKEGIKVDSINVLLNKKPGTVFTKAPESVATRITNLGNGFAQPFGKVNITKGSKTVYTYEFNAPANSNELRGNILPKSSRLFTDKIYNVGSLGKYSVQTAISYKQGGEVIYATKTFWVIPMAYVIGLAVLILVLFGLLAYLYMRSRKAGKKGK